MYIHVCIEWECDISLFSSPVLIYGGHFAILFMQLHLIIALPFRRFSLVTGDSAFSPSSLITKPCRNFAHVSGIRSVTRRPLHPLS